MSTSSRSFRFISPILNLNRTFAVKNAPSRGIPSGFPVPRPFHVSSFYATKIDFNLSDIGEGIKEVVVKEWYVQVGDKVAQFDNICEVQSDKASVTITSRYDGTVTKLYHKIDEIVLVGKPLVQIESEGDNDAASSSSASDEEQQATAETPVDQSTPIQNEAVSYKREICIPSVRRLAKEHSITLSEVKGTGKDGRILKEDVLRYLESSGGTVEPVPPAKQLGDRTQPIKGFQKAMVRTMTEALKIPHFVYSDEIAVTQLSKVRSAVKKQCDLAGVKVTFMPFFIKAASNALAKYPGLNAHVDSNCENITYKGAHNIGVAMDTKVGLAVPVIKNVQSLSIVEIAKELNRLMVAGKEGNFAPSDLQGGTFTISNIGIVGGTYTKPVILPPSVAIIAIGTSKLVPRFDEALNVVPEEVICLSGAADHRVVDGASMANFVNSLKKQIENPYLLFLNL